jgi:hypothetical protein
VNETNKPVASSAPVDIGQASAAEPEHEPVWVRVAYRSDPVDISYPERFELIVPDSALINGAAYDRATSYLLISLNGAWYHYCYVPKSIWVSFASADSKGQFYNAQIKDRYDCG